MSFVVLLGSCMQLKVTTYICNKTCHADVACCALPAVAAQDSVMSAIWPQVSLPTRTLLQYDLIVLLEWHRENSCHTVS